MKLPIAISALALLSVSACSGSDAPSGKAGDDAEPPVAAAALPEEMTLDTPEAGSRVTSPIELSGSTPGTWFFEGSFPIELETSDGELLAEGFVQAEGDWMTEDQVGFTATLDFEVDEPTGAILILMEDDPSGMQTPREARIPLTLLPGE